MISLVSDRCAGNDFNSASLLCLRLPGADQRSERLSRKDAYVGILLVHTTFPLACHPRELRLYWTHANDGAYP